MPSTRKMILSHVMNGLFVKMNRTKQVPSDVMETPLNRCLNTFDITLLGIGHMVGAGIYVLTGTVAREIAGPGIILSFLIAGLTSLLAALCYAEFGTRIPKAGSAYVYTYVSVGEFWAFVIGWNIILEHMIGAASVARAWSGYVDSLFGGQITNITVSITGELHEELLGKYPDLLAGIVCVVYALLLGLGVKISTIVNSLLTLINLVVVILVICVGFYYANEDNWTMPGEGFLPFGFGGVLAGAATCFYAFVGFDSIATSGEEAKNPSFSIPMATVLSMGVVTVGYILVSAAVTLMVPYNEINPNAALPDAFSTIGLHWIKYIVSIGALCGMSSTLFGSLFSLPRCMYSMASDGLLFSFLGSVNAKTKVPVVNLIISGICSGIIAILFDLEKLVEFMSIGTLLAYTIVSASVIILRYTPEPQPVLTPGSEMSQSTSEAEVEVDADIGTSPCSEQGNVAGLLKPQYLWLRPLVGNTKPGSFVAVAVSIFVICGSGICMVAHYIVVGPPSQMVYHITITILLIIIMISCLLLIAAHQQNLTGLRFHVPFVPFVPALSIFFNLQLMFHLNILTWIRFFVWMAVGMLVYFLYGIHNSKEGDNSNTYSMLMTSSEAVKEKWGSTTRGTLRGALTVRKSSSTEKRPIIDEEQG